MIDIIKRQDKDLSVALCKLVYKSFVYLLLLSFLVTNNVFALDIFSKTTLSPPIISQETAPTTKFDASREDAMMDMKIISVMMFIVDRYLGDQAEDDGRTLAEAIVDDFGWDSPFFEGIKIDLTNMTISDEKDIISIPFEKNDKKMLATIRRANPGEENDHDGWQVMRPYAVKIERDKGRKTTPYDRNVKGLNAPPTDSIIIELIKSGKVVEIYIDKNGKLKGNKVNWIDKYETLSMLPEEYKELWLGVEMDLLQIFHEKEIKKLEEYLKMDKYRIAGRPMRIRAVLGGAALGWNGSVSHSNFVHASVTGSVLYAGGALLEYMLKDGNEDLWIKIIDNDELKHFRGLEHDEKEVEAILKEIKPAVKEFEAVRNAFEGKGKIRFLLKELENALSEKDNETLFQFLSVCNKICLGKELYPVERSYPLKKAFALLDRKQREDFIKRVTSKGARETGCRRQIIVDDILLLVADAEMLKKEMGNWVEENAPELLGRSLWQISPEIWHEAGGLARVMQYHGTAIIDLLGLSDVRLRHVEPMYAYRVNVDGTLSLLNYSKDITHPVENIEEVIRKDGKDFEITVGQKKVKFQVFKGVNTLGIETYMVKDVPEEENGDSYYTHSLYNYKNEADPKSTPGLPTWEQFSVFISKASLELVRYVENEEGKEKETRGEEHKAPVLHLNDSQTALVAVYRSILLDEEYKMKGRSREHVIDPVLEDGIIFFTTHTQNIFNRYIFDVSSGYGDNVLNFMGVPNTPKYREMFKRWVSGDTYVYDIASAGIRFSDGHNAVSFMQRNEMSGFDDWINNTDIEWLRQLFRKMGAYVELIAISNADDRKRTAGYFRNIMKEKFGKNVDIEHPTPEQVRDTKKECKKGFTLESRIRPFYSTEEIAEGEALLDPDQIVLSSSGRLVHEKAGRFRALTNQNIKELLKKGAQIVIFGNVQTKIQASEDIKNGLIALIDEIKKEKKDGVEYSGRLLFIPRFSLKEQRMLLAATDLQISDSNPGTEAAGFTEQDVSVCGGLVLAPYRPKDRPNKEYGEGLIEAQGLPMRVNITDPQKAKILGNTVIPKDSSPEAYLNEMMSVIKKYDEGTLMYYQAESIRLSLVLGAYPTVAAYLRAISDTIAERVRRKEKRILERQIRKKEEEANTILRQIGTLYAAEDPVKNTICGISRMALRGEIEEAIRKMFTDEEFQGKTEKITVIAGIMNGLINAYMEDRTKKDNIVSFIEEVKNSSLILAGNSEDRENISRTIQVMSAQALSIIFWSESGYVDSAVNMWITAEQDEMVNNIHGEGKESFLSINAPVLADAKELSTDIKEAGGEGQLGYFWRGLEAIKKLGKNVFDKFIFNKEIFENSKDALVMYIMNHGIINAPYALKDLTKKGIISTIHDTFFVNDTLPGSYQTTSTGAGHFQGRLLDVKQMTEGVAVQVSVLYDTEGEIIDIVRHRVSKGDWFLALPGYVDYVVNLRGARFTDMSIKLSAKDIMEFNPYLKERVLEKIKGPEGVDKIKGIDPDELEKILTEVFDKMGVAAKEHAKQAPYIGIKTSNGARIVRTLENKELDSISLSKAKHYFNAIFGKNNMFLGVYKGLGEESIPDMIQSFIGAYKDARSFSEQHPEDESTISVIRKLGNILGYSLQDIETKTDRSPEDLPGSEFLRKQEGLYAFIDDNADFVVNRLGAEGNQDKVIRIAIEEIKFTGIDNIRDFLNDIQKTEHGYIELFSHENPVATFDKSMYEKYGLIRKSLPKGFVNSRANTISITPVFKGDQFATSGNKTTKNWGIGNMDPNDTVITPVGFNYDRSGILRSIFFGLYLSEIAEKDHKEGSLFVDHALLQIARLCFSAGIDPKAFDLTGRDLVNMATAPIEPKKRLWLTSFNKFLKLLPIEPVDTEELRNAYEHAREALIRA